MISSIEEKDYSGPVTVRSSEMQVTFDSMDQLREDEQTTAEFFDIVFPCKESGLVLDAVAMITLHEEADDVDTKTGEVTPEQCEELQKLLDAWCEKTNVRLFRTDFESVIVRTKKEE